MRQVSRILVVGLSNIGDGILMSPVIAQLHASFPQAHLTLLVGERAQSLFVNDPRVHRLICMEEFAGLVGRLRLLGLVWKARPDLLVDLRNTILPLVWRPWKALRSLWPIPTHVMHMRDRHLWRLARQCGMWNVECGCSIWMGSEDCEHVDRLMRRWGVHQDRRLVVMCPGARSHIKRWYADRFAALANRLIDEENVEVVFTGEPDEAPIIHEIIGGMRHRAHNAVGATTIRQLAALMQRSQLVITNDSAALHLACAVNVPVLALFGPTDPRKYGPTGARDRTIQRRLFCVPCERSLCRFNHECMRFIPVDEVYTAASQMLESGKLKVESGRTKGR